uniref:Uncharacterized protein n=1 Tax=Meloidogyne enterolobii TaxID=390850 RepID=A0A6V7VEC4_MELEN|nr:unnamed protein product [Meloidogyne enterolobii]
MNRDNQKFRNNLISAAGGVDKQLETICFSFFSFWFKQSQEYIFS